MSEAAVKQMTLAEFLRWEDGTDTRYELLAGQPVAMAPPAPPHGFLAARLCARIEGALQSRRPCMVQIEVGIAQATLSLTSIGLTATMSELYEGIDLPDQGAATRPMG